ncbi:MAG: LPS export ABC transporter periplasmic protein LptC, partial [Pseudomonadota bacterium]
MTQTASPDHDARRTATTFARRGAPDYARAHRHSRFVRFVKRALPAVLLLALVVLIALPIARQLTAVIELPFEVGSLHLSGTRLTMEVPKLSGFTDDGRAYRVNAATASQDLANPDILDLTEVDARMELANKNWASVKSPEGSVDTKRQIIWLRDGVDLASGSGYAGRMKDAEVDTKAGSVVTNNPVVLTYKDGKLVADRMTVTDRGNRAFFEGNVQLDFRMTDLPDRQTPPPGAAAPVPAAPAAAKPGQPANAAA